MIFPVQFVINPLSLVAKLEFLYIEIGHVWYISILTWLRGFQRKRLKFTRANLFRFALEIMWLPK